MSAEGGDRFLQHPVLASIADCHRRGLQLRQLPELVDKELRAIGASREKHPFVRVVMFSNPASLEANFHKGMVNGCHRNGLATIELQR